MTGHQLRAQRQREAAEWMALESYRSRLRWQYGADAAALKIGGDCPDAERDKAAWARVGALAANGWTRLACTVALGALEDVRWGR